MHLSMDLQEYGVDRRDLNSSIHLLRDQHGVS